MIVRIAQHRAGRGARLLAKIGEYGIGFEVVRTWPGRPEVGTPIFSAGMPGRLYPICQARRRAQRHQLRLF